MTYELKPADHSPTPPIPAVQTMGLTRAFGRTIAL